MTDFIHTLNNNVLLGDGAMGTMLLKLGLPPGENPELWMMTHPEKIQTVHRAYLEAGSQIIETNTFGANRFKLLDYQAASRVREINRTAVQLARETVGKKAFVAGIIGPTGRFPIPIGDCSWSQLEEAFGEQAQILEESGVDFIFLETFSDLGEIRAALYAAKKYTQLPVACSLTYSKGHTLTGTSPEVASIVLEAMGADVLGANCSTGCRELLDIMKAYRHSTRLPLLVEPNAGMPELVDGKTVYRETPEALAAYVEAFRQTGVNLIGACCGSTPEHIRAMSAALINRAPVPPPESSLAAPTKLTSRSKIVRLGAHEYPVLIGERINPTARKAIAQALREQNWSFIVGEGSAQLEAGAGLLDFNTGLPGADENHLLAEGVHKLQMALDAPLVLDCTKPAALEKGLQEYHGKALINSVNGEDQSLRSILPLAKEYGAAVLGLTLNENGIPETAEGRFAIAEKIMTQALSYGLAKEDILIDCLVLTAATSPSMAMETLKTISLIKQRLGLTTILGLSNVSHGLPQRSWLNSAFLALAIAAGLDAAIANPTDKRIQETLLAAALLSGRDPGARCYVGSAANAAAPPPMLINAEEISLSALQNQIFQGRTEAIVPLVSQLVAKHDLLSIVNQGIIPPLEKIGELFAQGKVFLPQLMLAGDAAKCAFTFLKEALPENDVQQKGTVIIGTVKGDIHDIGKNIVAALLENHGYRVIDLGKSVSAEDFFNAAQQANAQFVCLSALMTTTMVEMKPVIDLFKKENSFAKVLVGGAVVTADYALEIGADGYGKDAVEAVKCIQTLTKESGL